MSLSWRNRIQIFLAPDRVDLTGIARGIRPVQQFRQSGVCVQENDSRQQWKAPLRLLEQMIGQMDDRFRRGSELHITLSITSFAMVSSHRSLPWRIRMN